MSSIILITSIDLLVFQNGRRGENGKSTALRNFAINFVTDYSVCATHLRIHFRIGVCHPLTELPPISICDIREQLDNEGQQHEPLLERPLPACLAGAKFEQLKQCHRCMPPIGVCHPL